MRKNLLSVCGYDFMETLRSSKLMGFLGMSLTVGENLILKCRWTLTWHMLECPQHTFFAQVSSSKFLKSCEYIDCEYEEKCEEIELRIQYRRFLEPLEQLQDLSNPEDNEKFTLMKIFNLLLNTKKSAGRTLKVLWIFWFVQLCGWEPRQDKFQS